MMRITGNLCDRFGIAIGKDRGKHVDVYHLADYLPMCPVFHLLRGAVRFLRLSDRHLRRGDRFPRPAGRLPCD